jgi:Chaperone of endosialidase
MPKTKISEYSATANSNTDVGGINIDEGCAPSGINDAIRTMMAQLKNFQTGTGSDSFNGPVGSTTASTGAFTTLSASSTVSGTGFSTYLASPPAIGGTAAAAGTFTTLSGSTSVTTPIVKSATSLVLQTNGTTTAATFDTAQNMGLGVTPSASWNSGYKAIQIANASYGSLSGQVGGASTMQLTWGAYATGADAWSYLTTGDGVCQYIMNGGQHRWRTAASGTAGNAITFTQAMTLTAAGDLVLGTTSALSSSSGRIDLTLNGASSGGIISFGTGGTRKGYIYQDSTDFTIANEVAGAMRFINNGSERARIDSSGNLLVGQTSRQTQNSRSFDLDKTDGCLYTNHASGDPSGNYYVAFGYNGNNIGSIAQTGTTAVLYNTTSDQRLKENIEDAAPASNLIDALQVRQFDWKTDNSHQRYGFVAQELVIVAPEAVHQPSNSDEMMAVDYSKLVPMLVKEIQSLRQRLAALESN